MSEEQNITPNEERDSFDITIRNGAAQRLKELMQHFHIQTAKDTVGLALDLLHTVKDASEIVIKDREGNARQLIIPQNNDETNRTETN